MIGILVDWAQRIAGRSRFWALVRGGLPPVLVPAVRFLLEEKIHDPDILVLSDKIEAIRASVAAEGDKLIEILYSPKPGSSGTERTITSVARSPNRSATKRVVGAIPLFAQVAMTGIARAMKKDEKT